MEYRKSIAYNRNFETGKYIEVVKRKLIRFPASGTFKVELFDALTNRKIEEAVSENRISAVLPNIAYMDSLYDGLVSNNSNNYRMKGLCDGVTSGNYSLSRVMLLTDGNIAENQYDYLTYGNIIGYADTQGAYSGSNNKRGTVNTSESTITNNLNTDGTLILSTKRHIVCDFPTNAANGAFQSIYLSANTSSYESSSAYYPAHTNFSKKMKMLAIPSEGANNLTVDSNFLYALNANDHITVRKFDKRTYKQLASLTIPSVTIPSSRTVRAITWDSTNNCFWLLFDDGSFRAADANFNSNGSVFTKSSALNNVGGTDVSLSQCFMDICTISGSIYIVYYGKASGTGVYNYGIAKYNSDGTLSQAKIISCSGSGYTGSGYIKSITIWGNSKLAMFTQYGGVLDLVLNNDLTINYSAGYTDSNCFRGFIHSTSNASYAAYDTDTQIVFESDVYDSSINAFYIIPAGIHTLLASPVTKTATNTMKIQYDITMDYVYALDMPAH